ncbi:MULTISPECIES: IPT/TIG domain-containing protein [unclassified Streptomyces]|uniref:IPT/TIG domain-containing protein n=1 Tax=unclassified Streptomyces TaxID=2593676 RepID=UPI00225689F0|nr:MULTISPECIES: IPT/TIG domain-containing protein [unclassified Streptomyces]WSP57279.1 IPT/TIG domain-containing protein [Streptomyces sp. NBC_01241]WSU22002.1 IPT/TIG domain-containing protein [Streptomyces sp. NBC_01108]MCX4789096.1 IPT/TIG domain-containing protein [Streptomyces sp. NBC_01221]MCX4795158.1 IPT/TIG domain-containing protein [Streptomyces sp. NBC_01242]WSJ36460.1 IPT/TIG domain-containing protein [Streptomyces sp. NBC_01321]
MSSPFSGAAGTVVTLTGTGFTGATAVTFGGTPSASFTVVSATGITAVAPAGAGTVQIMVTTPDGTSNGIGFTYTIATPAISSVAPNQGSVEGGNTVTLTGTGFTGATSVRFGTVAAAFIAVSATQATAVAPAAPTGTVNVTITTPGGTSAGIPYTYVAAPVLGSVTPAQGPLAGGNTITLSGTGFTGTTSVRFGVNVATSFTFVSATQLSAVVPTGGAGPVAVTVTTPGGTSSQAVAYYYLGAPVLTSVVAGSGQVGGGNAVTLTGANLLQATAVLFGSTAATTFTILSVTEIRATVPPGVSGTVPVTVTTPGGTSNSVAYLYLSAPVVSGLVPNQGASAGGNTVTVTGSGLTYTTGVLFGSVPAGFTVVSDTQLTTTAPPGGVGAVTVRVVTPGGTSLGVSYTRVGSPGI